MGELLVSGMVYLSTRTVKNCPHFWGGNVGKYSHPMEHLGYKSFDLVRAPTCLTFPGYFTSHLPKIENSKIRPHISFWKKGHLSAKKVLINYKFISYYV